MPQIEPLPQVPCTVSSPFVPVPATAPSPTLFEIWVRAIPLAPSLGTGEEHPALLCNVGSLTQLRGRFIPQLRHFGPILVIGPQPFLYPRSSSGRCSWPEGGRPAEGPARRNNAPSMQVRPNQARTFLQAAAPPRQNLGPLSSLLSRWSSGWAGLWGGGGRIDLDPRTLRVNRSTSTHKGKRRASLQRTQNASRPTIDLPQRALEALKCHRKRRKNGRLGAGSTWQDNGLVCLRTADKAPGSEHRGLFVSTAFAEERESRPADSNR